MNQRTVRVKVPASTANLGPGFDAVGMAFQLYTTIEMRLASETKLVLHGEELAQVPTDKTNLLYEVAALLFQRAGLTPPELYMEVSTDVPMTRGLGSSAAAIVGALVAANTLADEPFTRDELFAMASNLEGHPDNVGASLFGGVVVATMPESEEKPVPYVRFDSPKGLQTLVIIPDFWLPTEEARQVLPEMYPRKDLVYNVGRSSLLVAALAQGRLDLLAEAMKDRLHQPYRSKLIPGLSEILAEATQHGAIGAALSGAGPTILCFYQSDEQHATLLDFVGRVMNQHGISYRALVLPVDETGVTIEII
ncbi:homoserine kinase [Brevibacillus dissolubilis]|uniref:homoserine kinase n=1 Tax=Brevibacillus dissolubilis TaxID=1844116 RepID=UPI00111693FD|nr:homoserine kinase [Brevibacillus dissolubilis]